MDAAIWGFIGVLVGGAVAIAAEYMRGRAAASLDAAKRRDDRQIGKDAFQRETLLALQEALVAFQRAVALVHIADMRTLKERGGLFLLPEGLSDGVHQAGLRYMLLAQRVTDDALRAVLVGLNEEMARIEVGHLGRDDVTYEQVEAEHARFGEVGDEAQKALGQVLRRYL